VCNEHVPALSITATDSHERTLTTKEKTHGHLTGHPWPTATLWDGNNIALLADAKIIAWSMHPAGLLTNILPKRDVE
jgi:hypothetical protein